MVSSETRQQPKATAVQLAFLIYGACCAGAFGLEEMVSASGPGIALATLVILPFLWSVPVALACAELTAAFPLEGGNYRWSRLSLGEFWGFQAGWWNWMTNFATNGAFAVLFVGYLQHWLPPLSFWERWGIAVALIWGLTAVNFFGIRVVGNAAIVMSVLLLLPFVALVVIGFLRSAHVPFEPFLAPGKTWLSAFGASAMLAIWLYSGFDKLSAAAGEVENPQRSFPFALFFAVSLTVVSYVLPTAAGLAALGNWAEWKEGYFSTMAAALGGPVLGTAMTAAALISNALLLNVSLLSSSRVPYAMAEDRMLPAGLARVHPRFGTPRTALVVQACVLSLLALQNFQQLIVVYAWLRMADYMLIFLNLWRLRRTRPDAARPFRVPGGKAGLALTVFPPMGLALAVVVGTVWTGTGIDVTKTMVGAVALASGPLAYGIFGRQREQAAEKGL